VAQQLRRRPTTARNTVDPKIITIVVAALACWGLYRRVRRSFGRQTISESRLWLRIIIWTVVGAVFAWWSVRNPNAIAALIGGLAGGTVLGLVGIRHTRFEFTPQGRFYIPHTYLGVAVTTLFVGRLLYRFTSLSYGAQSLGPNPDPIASLQRSPLTLAIFGLLVGYYLVFSLGVLQKARAANAVAPPAA
jgi:hypothetical protein